MATDRRTFLQLLGTGAAAAAFPASIARALEIPANHRTGTIADVEHIVILMQENRSFDHYFGTLRGVRGYGDPRAVNLPSGDPVWYQPNGSGYTLPFRPDAPQLGLQFIEDTPHDWDSTHAGWNQGNLDQWVLNKGTTSMAHLIRQDIPYHYALADAFTVCDAYHCSLLGPTDPNRYHMWTGWVGNDGSGGGPVIDNAEAGYGWSTYPERLQNAGISWKIYQDKGAGLDAAHYWGWGAPFIGNYGDNSLLYFHQYQNAAPGSPLFEGALTGTDITAGGTLFDIFKADVLANKLPQVSWIVAPESYSEHGNWPSNFGAWYTAQMLDALTANPEVWSKTAFFLVYDENDGFFDHLVPPTPPASRAQGISTVDTINEIFPGNSSYGAGPYGMGMRVPMVVISPWSKGGYVNSEVFDHTSLIRFIEARFASHNPGLIESNITPWRRAVAGDLTSAFNFKNPNAKVVKLPDTSSYKPKDQSTHPSYTPVPPTNQALPIQESGVRPAKALPYRIDARGKADSSGNLTIGFVNTGNAAAVFQVRSGNTQTGPWTYTVGPHKEVSDSWALAISQTAYDLSVYGPNGFLRAFKGGNTQGAANLSLDTTYSEDGGIALLIHNFDSTVAVVSVLHVYTGHTSSHDVKPGAVLTHHSSLEETFGWYDFVVTVASDASFLRHFAGHVETGRDSITDPAIAGGSISA
jgi:phospholipase C